MLNRIRRLLGLAPRGALNVKFGGIYDDWRNKRLKAIFDHYPCDFFVGKQVLEVGCGYGDIGAAFAEKGAKVTCSDARVEHLNIAKKRHPEIEVLPADLDVSGNIPGKWDVLIHMGLLYHLRDPEAALNDACRVADHLILETEVCDSDDPHKVLLLNDRTETGLSHDYDQAFNSIGGRPSAALVERVLEANGLVVERFFSSQINSSIHVYDWVPQNDGSWRHGLRRMWFAQRKPC